MASQPWIIGLSTSIAAVVISLVAFKTLHPHAREAALPLHKYEPLKNNRSTRLFTLLPALSFNTPVRGYLQEIDLDSHPSYEGLSYLCGEPLPGHEVLILPAEGNDVQDVSRLPVYPNCLAALRVLRYRLTSRQLWVDAISIDQAPSAEKSLQVKLMTEIYEKATRVLIALKPDTVSGNSVSHAAMLFRAMGWLYRMNLLRLYDRDEQADMRMPKQSRLINACDRSIEWYSKMLGDAFNAPFLNRYFRRVWTVQEIAMARELRIYYGTSPISWHDFVVAGLFSSKAAGFAKNQGPTKDIFRDYNVHWDLLNGLESHFVLPDIYGLEALKADSQSQKIVQKYTKGTSELALIKSKGLQAFDPKDKAYAMLWAFTNDTGNLGSLLDVDYQKPLEQIYTKFSTAVFVRSQGSSLQFYLINSSPRNQNLPSWVPDWSVSAPMSFFIWTQRLRDFDAAGNQSRAYRIGIEGAVLYISGVEYCKMKAILRLTETSRGHDPNSGDTGDLVEALIDAAELMRSLIDVGRSHAMYASDNAFLDAIHRVIHSQQALNLPGVDDQNSFRATSCEVQTTNERLISVGLLRLQVFDALSFLLDVTDVPPQEVRDALEKFLPPEQIAEILSEASAISNLIPFLAVVVALSGYYNLYHFLHIIVLDHRDKDLFITHQGTVGMAFRGVTAEDVVALWEGCPSPLILRQRSVHGEDDQKTFHIHGPAFVDGIMNGEGWQENDSNLTRFVVH